MNSFTLSLTILILYTLYGHFSQYVLKIYIRRHLNFNFINKWTISHLRVKVTLEKS